MEDRPSVGALFADAETMRFVGDGAPVPEDRGPHAIERIFEKYRTDPQFFVWAVEEGGEYAGHAELKRRAGRTEYEIVYILQRGRWGRGLGGRVVDLLLHEVRARRIPFVIATVAPDNEASTAILRARHFTLDEQLTREIGALAFTLPGGAVQDERGTSRRNEGDDASG